MKRTRYRIVEHTWRDGSVFYSLESRAWYDFGWQHQGVYDSSESAKAAIETFKRPLISSRVLEEL